MHKDISRVLIANNGIAAVKAIRSLRRWSYETFSNDKKIHIAVMTTPEDIAANLEYIHLADQHVEVPGGSSSSNYGNVDVILQAAIQTKSQVKH
jgi:acetyl-CoA carboxylase/biotin carboxylase 1